MTSRSPEITILGPRKPISSPLPSIFTMVFQKKIACGKKLWCKKVQFPRHVGIRHSRGLDWGGGTSTKFDRPLAAQFMKDLHGLEVAVGGSGHERCSPVIAAVLERRTGRDINGGRQSILKCRTQRKDCQPTEKVATLQGALQATWGRPCGHPVGPCGTLQGPGAPS